VPQNGTSAMLGKMIIGLIAVATVAVAPTVSASGKEKTTQQNTQQKKITVNIPKQVCETLNVDTKNWGEQTVQVCGPPGGPRGQATSKQLRLKPMAPRK
jgi:uncharacterized protein YcfJ